MDNEKNKSGDTNKKLLNTVKLIIVIAAGSCSPLSLILYFINRNDNLWLVLTAVFFILIIFLIIILGYKKINIMRNKQQNKSLEQIKTALKEVMSDNNEQYSRIIGFSDFIYKERNELWGEYSNGKRREIEGDHLLRSLVYPASSLYSVTAFVIGKDPTTGNATHMLLMYYTNDTAGRRQVYQALGQRMPMNSLPHNYAKLLVSKFVYNYDEQEIKFSEKFCPKGSSSNYTLGKFEKQVPRPFIIQEETNTQADGSPFFLDFIYVIEVDKFGTVDDLQDGDLKARWLDLSYAKEICEDVDATLKYGEKPKVHKAYIQYESQRIYAAEIANTYIKKNKEEKIT